MILVQNLILKSKLLAKNSKFEDDSKMRLGLKNRKSFFHFELDLSLINHTLKSTG